MGVIHGVCWPWQHTSGCSTPLLDVDAVCLFLRAQSSWLCRGLQRADDPTAVGIVLGAHDDSHESWLGLIAAVERHLGSDPAEALARLYGLHGRVVGSLEQGIDRRVPGEVAATLRRVLADRLRELTEEAVAAIHAAASAIPPHNDDSGKPTFEVITG